MSWPCQFSCSLAAIAALLILSATGHNIDKALHRERESDGAFAGRGDDHAMDGTHNTDFDHESILGSSRDADEFDHLPPEEAKRRLGVLLLKMDANGDQSIDTREMQAWILRSFQMLSKEESAERFEEADEDGDELVSWTEHLRETYGVDDPADLQAALPHPDERGGDTTRMVQEDRDLFEKADRNGDGLLDQSEFLAFSHPEEDAEIVPLLVEHALQEKDGDGDGRLSFAEYIRGQGSDQDEESLLAEKERFDEDYDKNLDGFLDPIEVQHWLVPDNHETATSETQHLFASADTDEDGTLSFEEILSQHELFVGSEVTDYGDHLHNLDRFPDEL